MLRWAQGRCLLLAGQVSDEELVLLVRGVLSYEVVLMTIPPIQANWGAAALLPLTDHFVANSPWQATAPFLAKVVPVLVATDSRKEKAAGCP